MTRIASSPADMRTMLKACAIALCCVPAPVVAAKGLAQEEALNEGLIAISMANVIRKTARERDDQPWTFSYNDGVWAGQSDDAF